MNERRARDFDHLPNLIAEVDIAGEEVSFTVNYVKSCDNNCSNVLFQCI